MEKVYVKDLQDRQSLTSLFLAKDKVVQTGKNGRSYMSLYLSDSTGAVEARVWDNVDDIDRLFNSGDVIKVKGQVQSFQNRRQLIVHKLERAEEGTFKIEDFISKSEKDPEDLFQALLQIAETIHDPHVKQLILSTLQDPSIRERLLVSPAAKTIHHAHIGGLLSHIISLCGIMDFLAQHYKQINRDLLIFGAIFHDIGKIWELQVDNGIHYTDEGRLIGHLVMSVELIEKKASKIFGFPDSLKMILKHIVLSHHGQLDYGSPKRPKTLEAMVVAMVDDLDSKIDTVSSLISQENEQWTKYSSIFDRYFYTRTKSHIEVPSVIAFSEGQPAESEAGEEDISHE